MKRIKSLFTLIALFGLLMVSNVYASGFSISASSNMTKGGKATLKIKGSDAVGRFNISTSNSSVVSISEGYVWVENNTVSITLSALKTGSAKITVTAADVSNNSGTALSLGSKSITINVTPPREKSSNNYLKGLTVEGFDLVPVFDKDTLEYNVSVPSTIEKVSIGASKEDNYASVSGTGEFEVEDGVNSFEITVTSETGAVKVYTVIVTVEDLNPISVKTDDGSEMILLKSLRNVECPQNYVDKSISIDGITIPAYYNEKNAITLVGLKDSEGSISLYKYNNGSYSKYNEIVCGSIQLYITKITNVLDGYISSRININNSEIDALKVSKDSKFAVIYGIDIVSGEEGYYTYDLSSNTILKYDSELIDNLTRDNKIYLYAVIVVGSLFVISFILNIVLGFSNRKKNKLIKKYIDRHEKHHKPNNNGDIVELNNKFDKDNKEIDEIIESENDDKNKMIDDINIDIKNFIDEGLPPEIPDEEAKISLDEVLKEAKAKKKNTKKTSK